MDLLMKHKKRRSFEQNINSNQNEKNSILVSEEGVVSNLKAEVVECVASTLDSPPLSSNKVEVETIVNRRYKELHDMIASKQEAIMNQIVQKLTSDFECKIEALRS
jgi:hypothetical protein